MKRILAALAILCFAPDAQAKGPAGSVEITVKATHRQHLISGAVWYPAGTGGTPAIVYENPVFKGTPVLRDAKVSAGQHHVVVLSHGLFAHFRTLSWLAAGLAERGAIVVAVNHPGSTLGDRDMKVSLEHWNRIADLQAAVAQLQADPRFAAHLDMTRVYAGGFSYGGWTALSMGGLTGNLAAYARHCAEVGERSTHCKDIARGGVDLATLDAGLWKRSYKDPRIIGVAVIEPALLYGVTTDDVKGLVDRVALIGLGTGPDRLLATDFGPSGSNFAALLPRATATILAPANHFSVLPECKPEGAAILAEDHDDPVCTDPAGTDRGKVHAAVIDAVSRAFQLESE